MRRIGIFGGSFNPIHMGHLHLGEAFLDEATLDELWFVVSPMNPLKKDDDLLCDEKRLEMAQLAIDDFRCAKRELQMKVSDYEFHLPRPSYMINTLRGICNDYADVHPVLLIGEDNWQRFPQWYKAQEILSSFEIFIYPRQTEREAESNRKMPQGSNVAWLEDMPLLDVSSTEIRQRLRNGESISGMVTKNVESYIHRHHLYVN